MSDNNYSGHELEIICDRQKDYHNQFESGSHQLVCFLSV